ncbi:MAG: sugar phosphate isomerase/epimerase [Clostridiales bacterium]|nr:sugar phosphate isomerase/epimerase [Clostridiales bacterium]
MRIGIRGHDLKVNSFEKLVEEIHNKGFKCTQLALKKAITEFNVDVGAMTPGMALYMKEVFQKNQVDVAVLGCYLNLATPDYKALVKNRNTYISHIRFASLLGCGIVGTETGAVNTEYKFEKENHSQTSLDIFVENLKYVVEAAEKLGVIVGIEPVYKHIVYDIERAYQVLQTINSPNLQIIFDPVNVLSVDNYKEQDDIINGAFELLGDDIVTIHAKDFVVEGNEIKAVPSGQGHLNNELLLTHIKKSKPFIHVLLENTQPDNCVQTREYMEKLYSDIQI